MEYIQHKQITAPNKMSAIVCLHTVFVDDMEYIQHKQITAPNKISAIVYLHIVFVDDMEYIKQKQITAPNKMSAITVHSGIKLFLNNIDARVVYRRRA
jgi:hypothetical protein